MVEYFVEFPTRSTEEWDTGGDFVASWGFADDGEAVWGVGDDWEDVFNSFVTKMRRFIGGGRVADKVGKFVVMWHCRLSD